MRRRLVFPLFAVAIAVAIWIYDRSTSPPPRGAAVSPVHGGTPPGTPPMTPSMRAAPAESPKPAAAPESPTTAPPR